LRGSTTGEGENEKCEYHIFLASILT
jgi:hypothetical protein